MQQLGIDGLRKVFEPKKILTLDCPSDRVQSVCCANNQIFVLTYIGELYICGINSSGQLGVPCRSLTSFQRLSIGHFITSIALDATHSYISSYDGIYACGSNYGSSIIKIHNIQRICSLCVGHMWQFYNSSK
jgi:alpha-tubulin suppressor-like RCC1 family protein